MEYVYTLCVLTGVRFLTRTIPLRNMNSPCVATGARIRQVYSYGIYTVVCSQGGEFFHLDYSSSEYSYAMCSHEGEQSPGIFLYGIKTPCVVTGVSFLTRTIPLRKICTPCVATGARIRRVYSHGIYTCPV